MTVNRRQFIQYAGVSVTAGIAGCSGGGNSSGGSGGTTAGDSGSSGDADYETNVKASTLIDAVNSDYVTTTIERLKANIEEQTNGEITVEIFPAGQIGSTETGNMEKVQQGTVEFGDTSVQNFAPVAPSFDVKNLPYFAGKNQEFVNLVMSDAWSEIVEAQGHEKGFEIFSYGFNDPRCWAPANDFGGEPPLTPEGVSNADITQRTGGSPYTNKAFEMLNANPTPIPWGESPTAIQQGTANAMYNAPQYHANSGFGDLLEHEVIIEAVHDGRVWAMNRDWYTSLPDELQNQIDEAGFQTTKDNARINHELRKNAVKYLHQEKEMDFWLVEGEKREMWKDAIAYDRNDDWNSLMDKVFPDEEARTRLEEATQQQSDIKIKSLRDVSDLAGLQRVS